MKIVVRDIFDKLNNSLAVIGKAAKDVPFGDIVLGSGQTVLVEEYIGDALRRLVSKGHGVFFDKSKEDDSSAFGIFFKSVDDQILVTSIELDIEGYILDYCLFRVFSLKGMNDLMKVYYDLSESRYNDLMYYILNREVPAESGKLSETSGSCV